jgi:hypothetical protein
MLKESDAALLTSLIVSFRAGSRLDQLGNRWQDQGRQNAAISLIPLSKSRKPCLNVMASLEVYNERCIHNRCSRKTVDYIQHTIDPFTSHASYCD